VHTVSGMSADPEAVAWFAHLVPAELLPPTEAAESPRR
jgi:hypothetical protein